MLGDWSYEAYDCKLARETKAATILQLSLYSHLVEAAQGVLPESMYVVPPGETYEPEEYRVLDYAAYYRYVKSRLRAAVKTDCAPKHIQNRHRTARSAGGSRNVIRNGGPMTIFLSSQESPNPSASSLASGKPKQWQLSPHSRFPFRTGLIGVPVKAMCVSVNRRASSLQGRESGCPVHEMLQVTDEHGLHLLPEPSPGDIFFDLEGDPFVGLNGREYLFGVAFAGADERSYECRWALDAAKEKEAFAWFVDLVMARWAQHPSMHIYHFAPYEPSALKRLMGRYGLREDEIDRMLRAKLFVDLHTVVKRSVRASVEQYSLKALEQFHGFTRKIPLEEAGRAMRTMQHALEAERAAAGE